MVPPSEGGLTEDALLSLPVYTGDDDDELDEDLSTVADVDLAPTLGVQGHRLRETAEPQFPIPSQKEGEPLLEATNKKDNFAVDTDPKLALTDEFAKDLNKYIPPPTRAPLRIEYDTSSRARMQVHDRVTTCRARVRD